MPCKQRFSKLADLLFHDARAVSAAIMTVSAGALLGAYFFQYVVGLAPCILCLYQRAPHAALVVLGLIAFGLGLKRHPKKASVIILLCAILYLVSGALGIYHTGVEQHWWVSAFEACAAPISFSADNLVAQLEKTAAVRCDAIAWQMFGISMAGYNSILSFVMAVYCGVAALLITRRANGF